MDTITNTGTFNRLCDKEVVMQRGAVRDTNTPKAMLIGRILEVRDSEGTVSHVSMSSKGEHEGVIVVGPYDLVIKAGYKVVIPTGFSPVGYAGERKVLVRGPSSLSHGSDVTYYTELQEPFKDLSKYFLEPVREELPKQEAA